MIRELEGADSARAFLAMAELRRLADVPTFLERVALQRREGYRLVASFEDGDDGSVGVAGFRLGNFLAWGRVI